MVHARFYEAPGNYDENRTEYASGVPAGKWDVVIETTSERTHVEMKRFGHEVLSSAAKARAFLQRAGILDDQGDLAAPYRAA